MKTITYVPKCCKGEDATCEGSVEIKSLGIEEKLTLLSDQGVDVGEDGETQMKGKKGNMEFLVSCIKTAKPKYVKIDIKHKASGTEYKSYDDLDSDDIGHGIITEIAGAMLNGFKLGNG